MTFDSKYRQLEFQCRNEGWAEKLKGQSNEGCRVFGRVRVNKVIGNIHLPAGHSRRVAATSMSWFPISVTMVILTILVTPSMNSLSKVTTNMTSRRL